jgi:hypothetical protein
VPALALPLRRALTAASFCLATLVAAAATVPYAVDHGRAVLGLAAVAAGGVLAARFPATALTAAVAVTAGYGTLTAYVPSFRARYAMDLVVGALWAAALWQVLLGERRPAGGRPMALGVLLLCAFLLVTGVQAGASDSLSRALKSLHTQEWPLAAVVLGAFAPWSARTRRRVADAVVAIAVLVGAYACLRYAVGPAARELAHAYADPANAGYRRAGSIDVFGSFVLPKDLGAWTAMALPFCAAAALLRTGPVRLAAALACPLLVVANFGSNTRTALIAFLAGGLLVLGLYPFLRGTRGPRLHVWLVAVLLAAGAGVGGFVLTQGDGDTRYAALLDPSGSQSYRERQRRWEQAWTEIRAAPLGGGLGTAGNVSRAGGTLVSDYTRGTIDSSYVKVALEQGAVLVLLLAALLALVAGLARRAIAERAPPDAAIALGAAGAVVALLVLMYAGVYAETTPAWLAWLLAALALGPPGREPSSSV